MDQDCGGGHTPQMTLNVMHTDANASTDQILTDRRKNSYIGNVR